MERLREKRLQSRLPIAGRTRRRVTEMLVKKCEENKRKNRERSNATQSESLATSKTVEDRNLGPGSSKNMNDSTSLRSQSDNDAERNSCNLIVIDDSDEDVLFVRECDEGEYDKEKELVSLDGDGDGEGDGVGVNGSEMGENNGFNFVNVKSESLSISSNLGSNFCGKNCEGNVDVGETTSVSRNDEENCSRQERAKEDDHGRDHTVLEISDEESEKEEDFSSEESDEEDNDDLDDEDYEAGKCHDDIVFDDEEDSESESESEVSKSGSFERRKSKKLSRSQNDEEQEERETCERWKVPTDEVGLTGIESPIDTNGGQKPNCVAERTRSHFSSEDANNRRKLGVFGNPICIDEEMHDVVNNDDDDYEGDEEDVDTSDHCQTSRSKNQGSRSRVWNKEEQVEDLSSGKSMKRKRIRSFKDHEVMKILADSIFGQAEVPCEEIIEALEEKPTLPLKFTFGEEESMPRPKSEEEKKLDELWAEMTLTLCGDGSMDNAVHSETATDCYAEAELDIATLCRLGKHQLILEEEVGLRCKYCCYIDLEIKYYTSPFDRNPGGRSERRESTTEDNIFDKLHNQDSGYGSQCGCDPCSHLDGTVWDLIPGVRKELHPHQREGFEFLWKNVGGDIYLDKLKEPTCIKGGSGCVISHAPGTGKTRLAIVFLQAYMNLFPTCRPVIIAPCSMLLTWEAEFRKWKVDIPFHNLKVRDFSGKENKVAVNVLRKVNAAQVSVRSMRMVKLYSWKKDRSILGISYRLFEKLVGEDGQKSKGRHSAEDDQVRKALLELPGLLVLDEGHTARNDNSLIWKALSKIKTEKRIILSGTPFQNNFEELFNTLWLVRPKFADKLSSKSHRSLLKKRRCKTGEDARGNWASLTSSIGKVDEKQKAEKLGEVRSMIRPFVHVHKGTILQERLPGLRDSVVILKPGDLQKKVLDRVSQVINKVFKLECAASLASVHPSLLYKKDFGAVDVDIDWTMLERARRDPTAGVKTKFLMELIRFSQARNEKVLIFSQYLHPLKFITEQLESHFKWTKGTDVLCMNGQIDIDQRQLVIKDFNNPESDAKVLLASTRACSEGISLVGASRVVLLDVVWNPSVERQAISRAYRLGQEKVVYIYHLITSGTLEEEKYCRQAEKERLSELLFYSADRASSSHKMSLNLADDKKDKILEEMLRRERLKGMFKKIIYQPKEFNVIESFGLADL